MSSFAPLPLVSTGDWGPSADVLPDHLASVPYASFRKTDRLGRSADFASRWYCTSLLSLSLLFPSFFSFSFCGGVVCVCVEWWRDGCRGPLNAVCAVGTVQTLSVAHVSCLFFVCVFVSTHCV